MTTRRAPPLLPENIDGSSYLYISLVRPYPCDFSECALRACTPDGVLHNFRPRVLRVFTRGPHTRALHATFAHAASISGVPCEFLSVSKETDTYPVRTASTT